MTNYGDLISSVSIVLGVLTYFLGTVYADTKSIEDEVVPDKDQENARKTLRKRVWFKLASQHSPLTLGFLGVFYLCLPASVTLIKSSQPALWNFDIMPSLFVFLESGIGACSCVSVVLVCKMLNKIVKAS